MAWLQYIKLGMQIQDVRIIKFVINAAVTVYARALGMHYTGVQQLTHSRVIVSKRTDLIFIMFFQYESSTGDILVPSTILICSS